MATQVNTQSFAQEVEQAAGVVLIDFYADWCAPCRMVAPILEEVAKERPDVKVVKVNIDETPELAQRFGIMSIPTLVLFHSGQMKGNWVGLRPKPVLLDEIDQALSGK